MQHNEQRNGYFTLHFSLRLVVVRVLCKPLFVLYGIFRVVLFLMYLFILNCYRGRPSVCTQFLTHVRPPHAMHTRKHQRQKASNTKVSGSPLPSTSTPPRPLAQRFIDRSIDRSAHVTNLRKYLFKNTPGHLATTADTGARTC